MPTLDSVITGLSPVSYISNLDSSVVDTGSLGSTWAVGMSLGQVNIVPSENGGSSHSALNGNNGGLTQSSNFSPGYNTNLSVYLGYEYSGVFGGSPVIFATDHMGNGRPAAVIQVIDDGSGNKVIQAYPGFRSVSTNAVNSATHLIVGTTYEVLVVFAATQTTIFINGVQDATVVSTAPIDQQLWVWGDAAGLSSSANGNYQRMAVFNAALTSTNATNLHNAFIAPPAASTLAKSYNTATTAVFTWDSPPGGTAPVVRQLQMSPSGQNTWTNVVGATASPFKVHSLTPSTSYDFRVLTTDAASLTATSNVVTFTTAAKSLAVNSPLAPKVVNFPSAITWTTTLGETVDVLLSLDGGTTYPITLVSGIAAQQGFARFWLESAYVGSNCKIKVTDGTTFNSTGVFSILAENAANLQPALTVGGNSSPPAVSDPGGSGAVPNYGFAAVTGESWSGTRAFGVAALSARTDGPEVTDTSPNIECVAIRANAGPWTFISVPSLNADIVKPVQWTPDAYPFDNAAFPLIRATQEFCAKINAASLANDTPVVLQAVVYPYVGKPTIVPNKTILANPSSSSTYFVSAANGTSGGLGTRLSPIDTIQNAFGTANTNGVLNGLTIVLVDGDHQVHTPVSVIYNVTKPISIVADAGAWANTRLIGLTDGSFCQINGTLRFSCRIDFSVQGTMLQTNQALVVWCDGAEIIGAGGANTMFAVFNGQSDQCLTECLVRDTGSDSGGVDWQTSGSMIRNVYALRCAGIVGDGTPVSLNFTLREQGQFNAQHSDVYGRVGSLNGVVIGTIADRCYRPFAGLIPSPTWSWTFINCDFSGVAGSQINHNGSTGQNILIAYLRTDHGTDHLDIATWSGSGTNSNEQFHANIFEGGFFDTASYQASFTYDDFGSSTEKGVGATGNGALTYNSDRTPVAANANFISGLPIWPFDALNRRRGLYSVNHATARGPYAAAAEYTATSAYTLTGPSSGDLNIPSFAFTITPNNPYTGTITPHSTGNGTFNPTSLTWNNNNSPQTFTYTPTSAIGSPHIISTTGSPSLIDPSAINYTINTQLSQISNLIATPLPLTGVKLDWIQPAGAYQNKIYRGTSPGTEILYSTIPGTNTYTDQSTQPGTTYYYKVSAINYYGEGSLSTEVNSSGGISGVTQTGSFSSIGISRNLPVINGSVRVPPDLEAYRGSLSLSSVLAVPGTSLIRLNGSGGTSTAGGKYGTQEIVQLPSVSVSGADATNNAVNNLVPEVHN